MRYFAILSAFLGLASVIVGAAGDHMLAGGLTPQTAHIYETALRYHQLYAILIICLSLYGSPTRLYKGALFAFTLGLCLFSGSLYASVLFHLPGLTRLTPFGGTALMMGWCLLIAHLVRQRPAKL